MSLAVFDSLDWSEAMKFAMSAGSLALTAYFWFVRMNRERVNIGLYPANGFEGALEPGGVGVWTGQLYLANCSILPTAIVRAEVALWWKGRWRRGHVHTHDGHELPWNLPPSQVFAKKVSVAFDIGADTPLERVYANRRLSFTFITIDDTKIGGELPTHVHAARGDCRRAA